MSSVVVQLGELRLNENKIASLPASLAANGRLKLLDLGKNQIHSFA